MRWVLFDLMVGAALVWLLWGNRAGSPEDAPPLTTAAVERPSAPVKADVTTAEPIEPLVEPSESASSVVLAAETRSIVSATTAEDRGRRLRALVHDAEALFLRAEGKR